MLLMSVRHLEIIMWQVKYGEADVFLLFYRFYLSVDTTDTCVYLLMEGSQDNLKNISNSQCRKKNISIENQMKSWPWNQKSVIIFLCNESVWTHWITFGKTCKWMTMSSNYLVRLACNKQVIMCKCHKNKQLPWKINWCCSRVDSTRVRDVASI